jgi:cell division protein FtsW (lipid II flippase)
MEVSALPPLDEIKKYSDTVCEQIRWKKVHPDIAKEMEDHLSDQRNYYLSQGDDEATATKKAVQEMGDAVSIGLALDKTYRPKPQWMLILLTITLMLVGTGVRYLIDNSVGSLEKFSMAPTLFALIIFVAAYFLDFTALAKYPRSCYFLVMVLSITCLIFSPEINGRAWFSFGGFSVSLSYLALIFPLAYALLIFSMRNKGTLGILFCGAGYLPYAIILLLVPSTSGFVIYTITSLILLLAATKKGWFGGSRKKGLLMILIPFGVSAISVVTLFLLQSYRLERIQILLDPYSSPRGYQTVLIREMMSGAVFVGQGTIPQSYGEILRNPWFGTDMVLTALTHQYGWIIFLGIALLFAVFSALGFYYISRQRSVLGMLVALSILMILVIQTVFYMVSNLGYGLFTELSLPLISYGKAAMLLNAGLIGIMLSVFRTGESVRDRTRLYEKERSLISYENGDLIIHLKG